MVQLQGVRPIKPGERLYQPIYNLLLFQSAVITAIEAISGKHPPGGPRGPESQIIVQSYTADIRFGFPAYGPLEGALNNEPLEGIGVFFAPGVIPKNQITNTAEFPHFLDHFVTAIFILHFEQCSDWLLANGRGDSSKWPAAVDFARVMRNAVAHGGRIKMDKTRKGNPPRPVSWKSLSYSESDNGKSILGTEVFGPDLIALMFDVDDELTAMGAPY